jgi:hypothetical protein
LVVAWPFGWQLHFGAEAGPVGAARVNLECLGVRKSLHA